MPYIACIGVRAKGAEPSLPENFFDSARKKITLPDSPHPIVISKNPGFRALYLGRRNEFRLFRLINTIFFIIGCGLLPEI